MSSIFIFIIHNVDHIYPAKGNSWRRGWDQGWPCSPCGGHLERLLKHELKKRFEAQLYQILRAVETSLLVRLLFPAKIFWYFWTSPGMQCHPSGPWQSPFALCQHLDKLADQLYRPDNWKLELIPDFLKFVPRDEPRPTTCREHCRPPIHKWYQTTRSKLLSGEEPCLTTCCRYWTSRKVNTEQLQEGSCHSTTRNIPTIFSYIGTNLSMKCFWGLLHYYYHGSTLIFNSILKFQCTRKHSGCKTLGARESRVNGVGNTPPPPIEGEDLLSLR